MSAGGWGTTVSNILNSVVRRPHRPRRSASVALALVIGVGSVLAAVVATAPSASAAPPVLSHVTDISTAGNRSTHSVRIPTTVQAGDRLVLFLTWNSQVTAGSPGAGWTQLQARTGSGISGRVWTKEAVAADVNALVGVTTSAAAKSVFTVVAYRSTGDDVPVTASAIGGSNTATSSHTTPAAAVADPNSWLVSAWSEKSGSTPTWTLPASVTSRDSRSATGPGKISMVVADSNGAVPTGTAAGRTATTSASVSRSMLYSVVVSPGVGDVVPNTPPTADFTFSCTALVCAFDAAGSDDVDGDDLTYEWDFGDGQAGSGVAPSHTYASGGTRTVTLTVDDGSDTDTASESVTVAAAPLPPGNQPKPGHTSLVPDVAHTNMPVISNGEIWDIEVVGNRAFVAGSFTSAVNRAGNGATVTQPNLLAFNLSTGLIDTTFRPTFGEGGVNAVEASPNGQRLYVVGSFNTVNGVTMRKIASLNLTTGAPVAGFQANGNSQANALAVTNTTVYAGGRFSTVNGRTRVGLVAVDGVTGAVDMAFDNQLSGGIGTNGTLTVQQLKLTHDSSKLLVVHTGRRIDGQDRYGVGLIDTATKELLPWHTRLWEDNLQYVGGIQRIYAGDIAPNDEWFVVSSGSGGDRPPINDTAVAFDIDGGANMEPRWISRAFDSIYSVAISEQAVYIGGHFQWNESPTAPDPWPGLDDVGYGTGQGLAAYALGDAVVRRDHLGALNPADGKALEWYSGSQSFEGNKAMEATPQGLLTGGDTQRQGGSAVGRVAFFPFSQLPAPTATDTTISTPIEGRVVQTGQEFVIQGTARSSATLARVQVEVKSGSQYLQDNMTSWGAFNTIDAQLGTLSGGVTPWSLPVTIASTREMEILARAVNTNGSQDPVKANKQIESFSFDDLPPSTGISSPSSTLQTSTSFVLRGSASDDNGVNAVSLYIHDLDTDTYLTEDGSVVDDYTTFRIDPDVPGAVSTTWQHEVTLPREGHWKIGAMAVDTAGQSDTRWAVAEYIVDSSGQPPDGQGRPTDRSHPADHSSDAEHDAGRAGDLLGYRHRRPVAGHRRGQPAQQHHTREPRLRRQLGCRRHPGLVQGLAGQPERRVVQLELHDAGRPGARLLRVPGPGDGQAGPDDLVEPPGPGQHQCHRARRPATQRAAQRDGQPGLEQLAPRSRGHCHRRLRGERGQGVDPRERHRPLPPAERDACGRLRHHQRGPRDARCHQLDVDPAGRPADQR